MDKLQSRKLIREKLELLSDKDLLSKVICKKIKALNLDCKAIMLYSALANEVNVDELIEYYIEKCDVYLPKVIGLDMVAIKVDKTTQYKIGAFGIKEPVGKEIKPSEINIDVCITPLLGFDEKLNRLGKGKGYYDKFFANCNTKKIGVAFEVQKLDAIEIEPYDKTLDMVITEDRTYANN
ncbi:MAG: 5-formyltetrahydrofolate cyclo-ligase [Clostridiales bacterium]|nr:5-formyltetrahydrofolate cyclo-ligase [Clostridiales bacterium]